VSLWKYGGQLSPGQCVCEHASTSLLKVREAPNVTLLSEPVSYHYSECTSGVLVQREGGCCEGKKGGRLIVERKGKETGGQKGLLIYLTGGSLSPGARWLGDSTPCCSPSARKDLDSSVSLTSVSPTSVSPCRLVRVHVDDCSSER
jgi:hypothetical protein